MMTVALLVKAISLYNLGKYYDALSEISKSLEADPENRQALYYEGRILILLEIYDQAVVSFDKILKNDPMNVEVLAKRLCAL